MPFHPTEKILYGDDAKTPATWARQTFCEWLAGKLNDPDGPYAEKLGLTPTRLAFVLENMEVAAAMYVRGDSPPVVTVAQGPIQERDYYRDIDGTEYKGQRLEMECTLGMGVKDRTAEDDDLGAERADDNNLAGFVPDAVRRGWEELESLGIFNARLFPDPEAGVRHPQKITFFILTLNDWIPTEQPTP